MTDLRSNVFAQARVPLQEIQHSQLPPRLQPKRQPKIQLEKPSKNHSTKLLKQSFSKQVITCDLSFQSLLQNEPCPRPGLFQLRPSAVARSKAVNWLVGIQQQRKLLTETLHLSVSVLDRYLAAVSLEQSEYPLAAATALWIAMKYEEVSSCKLPQSVLLGLNKYTRQDLLRMERHMLQVLDFALSKPTVIFYLRSLHSTVQASQSTLSLAQYLSELYMHSHTLSKLRDSTVAIACLLAAASLSSDAVTSAKLTQFCLDKEGLQLCMPLVFRATTLGASAQKIHLKFSMEEYCGVAYQLKELI